VSAICLDSSVNVFTVPCPTLQDHHICNYGFAAAASYLPTYLLLLLLAVAAASWLLLAVAAAACC